MLTWTGDQNGTPEKIHGYFGCRLLQEVFERSVLSSVRVRSVDIKYAIFIDHPKYRHCFRWRREHPHITGSHRVGIFGLTVGAFPVQAFLRPYHRASQVPGYTPGQLSLIEAIGAGLAVYGTGQQSVDEGRMYAVLRTGRELETDILPEFEHYFTYSSTR